MLMFHNIKITFYVIVMHMQQTILIKHYILLSSLSFLVVFIQIKSIVQIT